MESTLRRTWAEIDLDALAHNYHTLRRRVGSGVKFLGVVKADAYGHGAIQVSRTLEELGADYLAVSSIDEAMELREHGIAMPILILGYTPPDQVERLIDLQITQAVTSTGYEVRVHSKTAQTVDSGLPYLMLRNFAHEISLVTIVCQADGYIGLAATIIDIKTVTLNKTACSGG